MAESRVRLQFDPQEWLLLGLGVLVCAWTLERQCFALCAEFAVATALLAAGLLFTSRREASTTGLAADRWSRLRILASLPYMLWFYSSALVRLVPALGLSLHDGTMLAIDRTLFGETPSVAATALASPLLVEVLSACYVALHPLMACLLVWALTGDAARARRICQPSYLCFVVGFYGYLLLPCVGPEHAFAALYPAELPVGLISAFNTKLVNAGTAVYDVFPSLHTAIALTILIHDARANRRRFYWLLLPCTGIIVSTIFLRYHYAIDVMAGSLMAAAMSALPVEARRPAETESRLPEAQAA